jgi:hypothetical protein
MSPYPTRPRHRSSSDPLETVDKEDDEMGLGVSLFLIAVGAILTWAVNAEVSGLDITTVGVILLVVGVAGLLLSLLFWSSWGGPGYFGERRVRRTTYVEDGPPY